MRAPKLVLCCLSIAFLVSCHSKKQVVYKPVAKSHPKVVEKQKDTKNNDLNVEKVDNTLLFKSTEEYIAYFKDAAMKEMKIYKIPASITLAQGLLESSTGNSELTKRSNNHFGIKCHKEWEGESTFHDDDEKGECFRVYKDPAESYRDHSLFLTSRSRYSKLFSLENGDYIGWAKGLSEAGYATDKRYPAKLIGLIEKFDLQKYDTQVLGKKFEVKTAVKDEIIADEVPKPTISTSGFHVVEMSDTMYSIAKKYGISVSELMALNNLDVNVIYIGQQLKLVKDVSSIPNITKISNSPSNTTDAVNLEEHIVVAGDTLYNISKRYGLSVDELKNKNGLTSNEIILGQTLKTK